MKDQHTLPKAAHYCGAISVGGITAYVGGLAADGTGLVYLCLFGQSLQNVRSVWAALLSGKTLQIEGLYVTISRRNGPYDHFLRAIPTIGWHALLAWDRQATAQLTIGQDFFLLSTSKQSPIDLFTQRLDRVLLVPLHHEWGNYLWQEGRCRELITPIEPAQGVSGWKVSVAGEATDVWKEIIQQGITGGKIT